jgi:hypothetical protein
LRKLGAVSRGQVNFDAVSAAEAIADKNSIRGRRSDGKFGESRLHNAGSRCAGCDGIAPNDRNTDSNMKRHFHMYPEPLTAIAACP